MIIRAFIISIPLILSGCLSNNVLMSNSIAHQNVDKISQLQIGMTQEEVYQIMHYPSSEDQITTNDGCYNIWFYITKSNVLDQNRTVARNLTPLIFKDGVFIGMGRPYYNQLVQKSKEPQLAPAETEPMNTEERENIELEKTLTPQNEPTTKKTSPQQTKPVEKTTTPSKAAMPAKSQESTPEQTAPIEKALTPPTSTPVKQKKQNTKPLSMCSKPKRLEPTTEPKVKEPSKEDSSQTKPSKQKLEEEDREMLDQEREENFNDW